MARDDVYILTLTCDDRPGIVAGVTRFFAERGGNILEAQQFDDLESGRFFMRVEIQLAGSVAQTVEAGAFEETAAAFGLEWKLVAKSRAKRVLIFVSKSDHCLVDLLYRKRIGALDMDIVGIVSNHPREALNVSNLGDIPFHHLPVTPESKAEQEDRIRDLLEKERVELVVLARYMQILSDRLASELAGRCVNIHHSFLPGFKGARPYHQAHARGVKLIGATAHFVTPDLDEGPIIAQDVVAVTHADTPAALIRKGRNVEQRVLAQAIEWLVEDRVFLNGKRTVVFA